MGRRSHTRLLLLSRNRSVLEDSVESLRQLTREARAFVEGEYRGGTGRSASKGAGEERTLTISATDYVEGLQTIAKMHERSYRIKVAVYGEVKACKSSDEREGWLPYFLAPPCMDRRLIENILSRAKT